MKIVLKNIPFVLTVLITGSYYVFKHIFTGSFHPVWQEALAVLILYEFISIKMLLREWMSMNVLFMGYMKLFMDTKFGAVDVTKVGNSK